ncbi:MAG: putative quinol monooxygenase [Oscillospiraceae bacterium]|nr:putative quinol monooxygenase [Oscillospiraceae bacterium]
MEKMILHVTYHCKPGKAEALVAALKDSGLQAKVRSEDGCEQYDYHISCEQPDAVVLLECWRDADALACHASQPHMQEIQKVKAIYADSVDLKKFSVTPV